MRIAADDLRAFADGYPLLMEEAERGPALLGALFTNYREALSDVRWELYDEAFQKQPDKSGCWPFASVSSRTTRRHCAGMGWLGGHLHAFEGAEARYAMPDPEWPGDDLDELAFRVRDVLPDVGSKLRWDYDFGDGWEHEVVDLHSARRKGSSTRMPS